MQYKKFVLPLNDDGAQEAELNRFLRGHRVLKVETHYSEADALWAFLVCYLDGEQRDTAPQARRSNTERFDPSKELNEEQMARYSRYADARLRLARRDGVKAFVVFTNRELAELARQEETLTVAMLRQMDGMGEARIEKYGRDFLRIVNDEEPPTPFESEYETRGTTDGEDSASRQPAGELPAGEEG